MESALVTGAAGFIGSALTDRLRAEGTTVIGVDVRANVVQQRTISVGPIQRTTNGPVGIH